MSPLAVPAVSAGDSSGVDPQGSRPIMTEVESSTQAPTLADSTSAVAEEEAEPLGQDDVQIIDDSDDDSSSDLIG